jgi:uncharacterized membrane-anchored protein
MSLIRNKFWNRDYTKRSWTIQVETNDEKSWKTKTNFYWSMRLENWSISSEIDEYFVTNEFTRLNEKDTSRFYATKRDE